MAGGLAPVIYLSIGSRVMLRRNLWTKKRLVNGAMGTVTDIVYEPESNPFNGALPIAIMVKFDSYIGPTINGSVPIAPQKASWKSGTISCSRVQFPIQPAYAVTIHKSQGLTLDNVVIDIGKEERSLGMTYVALSRVKKIEGLAFEKVFTFDRFEKIKNHP